jgi:D-alanine-D-alanine ligase
VKKLRVGIIYGGRSGEHEVSVASAASVFKSLDRDRYEPVPIRIEKDGRWTLPDRAPSVLSAGEVIETARLQSARPIRSAREAHLVAYPGEERLLTIERRARSSESTDTRENAYVTGVGMDVIFPVLHGPYGEDGTVQGLLELANVPYVGTGVLASAVGMDKAVMKSIFRDHGLPSVDCVTLLRSEWRADPDGQARTIVDRLGLPVFVKPANLGSSVGISKVKAVEALGAAMDLAGEFDRKLIIEAAVPEAREIECAVLGNDTPEASVAGEVVPSREFYDYEAKYLDDGSKLLIPAPLSDAESAEVRRLSVAAFRAIDGSGMARVDFLLSRKTGRLYVNEVNTIPGFTTISMYAKLWEATGVSYAALLDRLIELAFERHAEKQLLRTSVT